MAYKASYPVFIVDIYFFSSIDIFWTGDHVISSVYHIDSLERCCDLFQRKISLWDNSVANDGRLTADFIPLKPLFKDALMSDYCRQRFINPMNQFSFAQMAVLTLIVEEHGQQALEQVIHRLEPNHGAQLLQILPILNNVGLSNLNFEQQQCLRGFSQSQSGIDADIQSWLNQDFAFDPACLT